MDADSNRSTCAAPCVPNSPLPGLLGLKTLERQDSALDCRPTHRKLYMRPAKIEPLPGCRVHQLEKAPS
eukprot:5686477-Pyramimonas_sp.AAC.1